MDETPLVATGLCCACVLDRLVVDGLLALGREEQWEGHVVVGNIQPLPWFEAKLSPSLQA